jgi:hypothetical protein
MLRGAATAPHHRITHAPGSHGGLALQRTRAPVPLAATENWPDSARVTVSPCHRVTVSPCHLVTVSSCHLVTVSPSAIAEAC